MVVWALSYLGLIPVPLLTVPLWVLLYLIFSFVKYGYQYPPQKVTEKIKRVAAYKWPVIISGREQAVNKNWSEEESNVIRFVF